MNAQTILTASPREVVGKNVKKLRRMGILPANIFGNTESKAVQLKVDAFRKLFAEAGETTLISLTVEGEKASRPVLIAGVGIDPVSGHYLHVDFKQVNLTEKIEAEIPLEFVGEAPAVKTGLVFLKLRTEVPVRALPTDLPERFEVDISSLAEVGQTLTIADMKVDASKVEVLLEAAEQLATIQAQEEEKVEETPVETVTTVQKTEEELAAEAAAKAAGENQEAPAKEE